MSKTVLINMNVDVDLAYAHLSVRIMFYKWWPITAHFPVDTQSPPHLNIPTTEQCKKQYAMLSLCLTMPKCQMYYCMSRLYHMLYSKLEVILQYIIPPSAPWRAPHSQSRPVGDGAGRQTLPTGDYQGLGELLSNTGVPHFSTDLLSLLLPPLPLS